MISGVSNIEACVPEAADGWRLDRALAAALPQLSRERLKAGLSRYAEHRAAGPAGARFAATTWGRHMSILSSFYRWAIAEGHAAAEPFTHWFSHGLAIRPSLNRTLGSPSSGLLAPAPPVVSRSATLPATSGSHSPMTGSAVH